MGACLDTGAQRSVCSISQAITYNKLYSGSFSRKGSAIQLKFGEQLAKIVGSIWSKIHVYTNTHIDIILYVVEVDIPLIIGLDILRSRKLLVNYVYNTLHYCNEYIKRPLK